MKLIFVYNADSGLINNALDIAHKIIQPTTYSCSLCQLTHGSFREKKVWSTFRKNCDIPMEFYHKDEFEKQFRSKFLPKYQYPLILSVSDYELELLMTAGDLNKIADVEELITQIGEQVNCLESC